MEGCPISFMGIVHCSGMLGRRCLLLQNEGVPDGVVSKMPEVLEDMETWRLKAILEAVEGEEYGGCVFSGVIAHACRQEIERRQGRAKS